MRGYQIVGWAGLFCWEFLHLFYCNFTCSVQYFSFDCLTLEWSESRQWMWSEKKGRSFFFLFSFSKRKLSNWIRTYLASIHHHFISALCCRHLSFEMCGIHVISFRLWASTSLSSKVFYEIPSFIYKTYLHCMNKTFVGNGGSRSFYSGTQQRELGKTGSTQSKLGWRLPLECTCQRIR